MSTILSFIQILETTKQYSAVLCSLKFEKSLFSNKFFNFIFRNKMAVLTAEKDEVKYFTQN